MHRALVVARPARACARVVAVAAHARGFGTPRACPAAVVVHGAHARRRMYAHASAAAAQAPASSSSAANDGTKPQLAWKAAIDFKYVRDNADAVQRNAAVRKVDVNVSEIVSNW